MSGHDLTIREIADRMQINDLLVRYTTALDRKDWALLDACFTDDALVDYTASGGVKGAYAEVRAWFAQALAPFPMTVHYLTSSTVQLDGDHATARTTLYKPAGVENPDGSLHMFTRRAYYVDELARTRHGWRIATRIEELDFVEAASRRHSDRDA